MMFGQTFVNGTAKTNRLLTTLLGFAGQIVVVGVAILIPLYWTESLPIVYLKQGLVAPPPPPPPPPPSYVEVVDVVRVKQYRQIDLGKLMEPKAVPEKVVMLKEEELPTAPQAQGGIPGGVPGGVPGGTPGGVPNNLLGDILRSVPHVAPPPPPAEKKAEATKPSQTIDRIRVGGNVQQAKLVRRVTPAYPVLAKNARIQGVVRLNAIIGKEGIIHSLSLISGHPMLVPAAMEAVKQWVYAPTLLNGEPVEVVTQIDVNFTLSQ